MFYKWVETTNRTFGVSFFARQRPRRFQSNDVSDQWSVVSCDRPRLGVKEEVLSSI